jgi:hypothetical protein
LSNERHRLHPAALLAMLAAIIATIVFAFLLVRGFLRAQRIEILRTMESASNWPATSPGSLAASEALPAVTARITAGDVTIDLTLDAMAFTLQAGESLDPHLPPGAFRAEFNVPFRTNKVYEAMLGAEFRGGKVMLLHRGKPVMAEAAREQPRTVLSPPVMPVNLTPGVDELTIVFENDGRRPCALRALWQPMAPEMAQSPQSLPTRPPSMSSSENSIVSPATQGD